MPRARKGAARARKRKKILKATRGQIGAASRRYRVAREAWMRAGQYATIGRKLRKRDFRRLWITRISAACRQRGVSYSRFMHGLAEQQVAVNRKALADLAVSDPAAFDDLVAVAAGTRPAQPAAPAAEEVAAKAPKAEKPKPKARAARKPAPKPAAEPPAAPEEAPAKEPAKPKKSPAKAKEPAEAPAKKTAAKAPAKKKAAKAPARKKPAAKAKPTKPAAATKPKAEEKPED